LFIVLYIGPIIVYIIVFIIVYIIFCTIIFYVLFFMSCFFVQLYQFGHQIYQKFINFVDFALRNMKYIINSYIFDISDACNEIVIAVGVGDTSDSFMADLVSHPRVYFPDYPARNILSFINFKTYLLKWPPIIFCLESQTNHRVFRSQQFDYFIHHHHRRQRLTSREGNPQSTTTFFTALRQCWTVSRCQTTFGYMLF